MTTSVSGRKTTSACNGVTTSFAVPWQFQSGGLQVYLLDAIGDANEVGTLLTEGVDYTVAGDGAAGTASITTTTAYPAGKYLRRWRETDRAQEADYTANDGFAAATHEQQLDRLSMVTEELDDDVGDILSRAILAAPGHPGLVLPVPSSMKSKLIGTTAAGGLTVLDRTDFRGDPGGNILAIGTFSAAHGMAIPAGTNAVETTGWASEGRGSGRYLHTPTFTFARVGGMTLGSAVITGLVRTDDIHVGAVVSHAEFAVGTTVIAVGATSVTLSSAAIRTDSSESFSFTVDLADDDTFGEAWISGCFKAADGRWFMPDLERSIVTAQMFGVTGDAAAGDDDAFDDFQAFTTLFRCSYAFIDGTCYFTEDHYWGRADGVDGLSTAYGGHMILRPVNGSTITKMIHMRNMKDVRFLGRLDFIGYNGSTAGTGGDYVNRTAVACGLWLDECRGTVFEYISCRMLWYAGVATQRRNAANTANSNNNLVFIKKLQLQNIGSGDTDLAAQSLTAAFTCLASGASPGGRDSGSASNTDQRSTINIADLTKLPPAALHVSGDFEALGTSLASNPVVAFINEQPRLVRSIDRVTGDITLYPWLDPSVGTSGTVTFSWGGGLVCQGSDANLILVGMIEGRIVSSPGLAVRSGQGCHVTMLSLQNDCGIGIMVGDTPDPILAGNNIYVESFYPEGPDNHVLFLSDFDLDTNSGQIRNTYLHDWSHSGEASYKTIHAPLDASYVSTDESIARWVINVDGLDHRKKVHPSIAGLGLETPEGIRTFRADSGTMPLLTDVRISRLFDYDRQGLIWHGSGPNRAPTGTIGFSVATGQSLNGVAGPTSLTWSGFTSAAWFSIVEASDGVWEVSLLAGKCAIAGSAVWDPANLAANASEEKTGISVPGAIVGDAAVAGFTGITTAGWRVSATITAPDTAAVLITNFTGGAVNLPSGTVTVRVLR